MADVALFMVALALYCAATFAYMATWLGRSHRFRRWAPGLLMAAVLVQAGGIAIRWVESGYPPLSNGFESLAFYGWILAAVYAVLERRIGHPGLGAMVTPIALAAILVASVLPKEIQPLIPVLQSRWLGIHVGISFLAYAVFTMGFAVGVAFLRLDAALKRGAAPVRWDLPALVTLDNLGRRLALVGFFLMTGSLLTGSIWAEKAWGVIWVWQPQQTAALVTWLIYAVYFYTRHEANWRGRRSAWLLVVGFAAMLFTFVGVDLLMPGGLHSFLF